MKKTEAIVLSKIKYNENKNIVKFYSSEFGLLSVLMYVSNTAKKKSNQNLIFPLNILEIDIDVKLSRQIQTLKYCYSTNNILTNIRTDIIKTCISQFISELISKTIHEEISNKEMYNFIKEFILVLNSSAKVSNYHLYFLNNYAKKLGFAITNNYCKEMPFFSFSDGMFIPVFKNEKESLDIFYSEIFSNILNISVNSNENASIINNHKIFFLDSMLKFYRFHLNNNFEIKSLNVLHNLFN